MVKASTAKKARCAFYSRMMISRTRQMKFAMNCGTLVLVDAWNKDTNIYTVHCDPRWLGRNVTSPRTEFIFSLWYVRHRHDPAMAPSRTTAAKLHNTSLLQLGEFVQKVIERPHVFFVADATVSAQSLSATKKLYDIGEPDTCFKFIMIISVPVKIISFI
ncbi:hypothetical protein BC936DRAFT_147018 [Jimgerdemannia flammicorona]|uniref:Uncharacterized protein n=2 Tax=Jimgerdemannia flammicorona TaxID=994334 RepID=A0A433D6A0_9FUNG|nr:hypothetical protein BC936DRAFT_147018 [Jimgerdemannia flammicorona]RUS28386.1 hypothetical protein BC938DRAFT_481942 [Jimgerdemannia flammicorona]